MVEFDLETSTSKLHLADPTNGEDQNAVQFSKGDPFHLFSGGDNGLVTCWDTRLLGSRESPVGHMAGHSEGITSIDTATDGFTILTNSKDQTIKLWDIRMFSKEETAKRQEQKVVENGYQWDYRYNHMPEQYVNRHIRINKGQFIIDLYCQLSFCIFQTIQA